MHKSNLIQQNHSIFINTTPEVLWHKMLDLENYKYWTQEFEPTSYYEGKFGLGEEILFLSSTMSGMVAKVVKFEKYKSIGYKFTGSVDNGIKDTSADNPFAEGVEEYYLEDKDGGTQLKIIVDTTPENAEYMTNIWQKGLARLKELAQSKVELKYITPLVVKTTVKASPDKVWECWTTPKHIEQWSHADDTWSCRDAKVDLRVGGKFSSYLYALDGSFGFDFSGIYTEIIEKSLIKYTLDDGRKVTVMFYSTVQGKTTNITQYFEPETENSLELQQSGWQQFMDNFQKYVEND